MFVSLNMVLGVLLLLAPSFFVAARRTGAEIELFDPGS